MKHQVIEAIIANLENEITNCEVQRYLQEVKIEDAEQLTNNEKADAQLKNDRWVAENTIAMLDRQIDVRRRRIAELRAVIPPPTVQRTRVVLDEPAPEVPAETANARQMPDLSARD